MHNKKNNKSAAVARRAWRFLRIALLWASKGGILKNRLVLAKHFMIKTIRHHHHHHPYHSSAAIAYTGERELSFDETPVIHVRMHRPSSLRFKLPRIPCINPASSSSPVLDFHYGFRHWDVDDDDQYPEMQQEEENVNVDVDQEVEMTDSPRSSSSGSDDEEIDLKAEEFIAKFYQQIKLQRQISYLQYNEMISRGAN